MTESEAKTKWCPFARAHWSGGGDSEYQGNRFYQQDGKTIDSVVACIGSACMAWRWDMVISERHEGRCGLAGDRGLRR